MVPNIRLAVFLACLALGTLSGRAQELGRPFIHNYSPKEYKASIQNWAIAQDSRGILYVGNNGGLLEYDGAHWTLIPINNGVRAIDIDPKTGIVYIGTVGELGYMEPDSIGNLVYVSIKPLLSQEDRENVDVLKIHVTQEGVYFQSFQNLVLLRPDGSIKVWRSNEEFYHLSFVIEGILYLKKIDGPLCRLSGERIESIAGSDILAPYLVHTMLPFDNDRILIGTRAGGLFMYNTTKVGKEAFSKWNNEANELLSKKNLYHGVKLTNGDFAFGTIDDGIVVLNPLGKYVQHIGKNSDLQDETVYFLFVDRQQTLWAALDNGISRVEADSPFSYWDESSGLKGVPFSIRRFQGKLYVATADGVFYSSNDQFKKVEGIDGQCWDMVMFELPSTRKEKLLVANAMGVYEISGGKAELLHERRYTLKLLYTQFVVPRLYIASSEGLMSMRYADTSWVIEPEIPGTDVEIHSMAADAEGNVWLGTLYQGIIRIRYAKEEDVKTSDIRFYTTEQGLPTMNFIQVHPFEDHLVFATEKGMYAYDKASDMFVEDHTWGLKQGEGAATGVTLVAKEQAGANYWLRPFDESKRWIEVYTKQTDRTFVRYGTPFKILPEMDVFAIYPERGGITWIGGTEGLFRYDAGIPKNYKATFNTLIRKVVAGGDSLLFQGNYFEEVDSSASPMHRRWVSTQQPESIKPVLDYHNNSITFHFSVPHYEKESSNQVSYRLEGYDSTWSAWAEEQKKEYTNLPEGFYTFSVKSLNVYGVESSPATFEFVVLPPVYRTFWAYFAYFIGFVLLIYALVKLNTRRLQQEKEQLANLVSERTQEISKQKEQLEKKNRDMLASINYAQRIQAAILPDPSILSNFFSDYFIYLKPCQIVSGDFYWFTEQDGKLIIAAVDCTGHGVPGAFMSVIGVEQLTKIVNVGNVTEPDEILNQLRVNVRNVLKQSENQNRDGMDIGICTIDLKKREMAFSGARRPMVYFRTDGAQPEMFQLKSDKITIGGIHKQKELFFTKQVVPFKHVPEGQLICYLFTDGYQDQFGGSENKKFLFKNMLELLSSLHNKPMKLQKSILDQTIREWIGKHEQTDDMLIVGFKL